MRSSNLKSLNFLKRSEFLWPKVLPLTLLTILWCLTLYCRAPFGKHKFTSHETVTGRPRSLGIQLSAHPLFHANVISYCKTLIS